MLYVIVLLFISVAGRKPTLFRGWVFDKGINIMKMAKSNEEFRRYCALVVQNNPVA
jgi:hypothetical protein